MVVMMIVLFIAARQISRNLVSKTTHMYYPQFLSEVWAQFNWVSCFSHRRLQSTCRLRESVVETSALEPLGCWQYSSICITEVSVSCWRMLLHKKATQSSFDMGFLTWSLLHSSFRVSLVHWLGKAMAPHSSTLAWKIPWMEEPGRLQSMGSLRVGHD